MALAAGAASATISICHVYMKLVRRSNQNAADAALPLLLNLDNIWRLKGCLINEMLVVNL
jgi:hypothetical protein